MNRTQKGAWYTLVMAILVLGFGVLVFLGMFGLIHESPIIIWGWFLVILMYMLLSFVLVKIKRSGSEPNADERDKIIRKNAVLVSFISVLVLSVVASVIPCIILEGSGSIRVVLLPIINFGVLLVTILIYSIAVLIQYPRNLRNAK